MVRLSDTAIEIINELHTERLDYYSEYIPLIDAANRLAAYEDSGLEPEEIKEIMGLCTDEVSKLARTLHRAIESGEADHLRDLLKAENEGRLVVLPSKTVWELTWDAGSDCDLVCPVSVDGNGCCDFCDKGKLFVYERTCTQELLKELGKTVFLTREEAEKALEAEFGGADHEAD